MQKNKHHKCRTSGFTALVAVLLLSFGTLAISMSVMGVAATYADAVRSREVRTQNVLNERACADTALLMTAKNLFLEGVISVPEFGCTVRIIRVNGNVNIDVLSLKLNP